MTATWTALERMRRRDGREAKMAVGGGGGGGGSSGGAIPAAETRQGCQWTRRSACSGCRGPVPARVGTGFWGSAGSAVRAGCHAPVTSWAWVALTDCCYAVSACAKFDRPTVGCAAPILPRQRPLSRLCLPRPRRACRLGCCAIGPLLLLRTRHRLPTASTLSSRAALDHP